MYELKNTSRCCFSTLLVDDWSHSTVGQFSLILLFWTHQTVLIGHRSAWLQAGQSCVHRGLLFPSALTSFWENSRIQVSEQALGEDGTAHTHSRFHPWCGVSCVFPKSISHSSYSLTAGCHKSQANLLPYLSNCNDFLFSISHIWLILSVLITNSGLWRSKHVIYTNPRGTAEGKNRK